MINHNNQLIEYLEQFVTKRRLKRINKVLENRTRYITVVLEDIFQSHNVSAVLRSCDLFGIQDVHIIENNNEYNINPDVALGAANWLDLHRYNESENNTKKCLSELKKRNYIIAAASPHKNNFTLEDFPIDKKTALIFGTELEGLSDDAIKMADCFVKIPMFGFTESFNISVAVAIFLYKLTCKLRNSSIDWKLSNEDTSEIKLNWLKNSVKNADALLNHYFAEKKNKSQ